MLPRKADDGRVHCVTNDVLESREFEALSGAGESEPIVTAINERVGTPWQRIRSSRGSGTRAVIPRSCRRCSRSPI